MSDLIDERVRTIYKLCSFQEGLVDKAFTYGNPDFDFTQIEGFRWKAQFNSANLASYISQIEAMLQELPDVFREEHGGGLFSGMQYTNDGHRWTTSALTTEKLLLLGMAIGRLRFVLPKHQWKFIKNGEPIIVAVNEH
jgi:hypothetical protein